ncbi:cell division protein CrgA [Candidatus Protochlamydia sp. R18]|uniref:cell division protein CrgA n=1 Tax=Candidatus Protochlamydia sp. R18 TaxID=1353977 RepID=UPI000B115C7E|nr:cell division protein CrgA [Candidatus Protochlamydia sp. R18]
MHNNFVLRTAIPEKWIKKRLWKGIVWSLLGLIPMIYVGGFAELPFLQKWGIWAFLIGFGLITAGLVPYKKLISIQQKPHELRLSETDQIDYYLKGKKVLGLPISSIKQIEYYNKDQDFGIIVRLKVPLANPFIIYSHSFSLVNFQKKSFLVEKADIFFPYFTQRSFDELQTWLLTES